MQRPVPHYQPTSTRSLQPDLLVVTREDRGPKAVTMPLALAVEVLSPSSRGRLVEQPVDLSKRAVLPGTVPVSCVADDLVR